MAVQGTERMQCLCGNETFYLVREMYGDNITEPGTEDTFLSCTACRRKRGFENINK